MLPFTKPRIEDLVAREIVLTNFNLWTNRGTILTPNNIDYNFVYRALEEVIGDITIHPEKITFIKGNMFHYRIGGQAGRLLQKYDANGIENSEYAELSEILDYVSLPKGSLRR